VIVGVQQKEWPRADPRFPRAPSPVPWTPRAVECSVASIAVLYSLAVVLVGRLPQLRQSPGAVLLGLELLMVVPMGYVACWQYHGGWETLGFRPCSAAALWGVAGCCCGTTLGMRSIAWCWCACTCACRPRGYGWSSTPRRGRCCWSAVGSARSSKKSSSAASSLRGDASGIGCRPPLGLVPRCLPCSIGNGPSSSRWACWAFCWRL